MAKFLGIILVFAVLVAGKAYAVPPFSRYNDAEAIYVSDKDLYYGNIGYGGESRPVASEPPRVKVFYLGAYGGWTIFDDDLKLKDRNKCAGNPSNNLVCSGAVENPINLDPHERPFFTGVVGVNSEGPLRMELSYFQLGRSMKLSGKNTVVDSPYSYDISYDGKISSLEGGTVNVYLDVLTGRNRPFSVFVPYVMGGVGRSQVKLGDTVFVYPATGNTFTLKGSRRSAKTIVYGAGLSIGVNNYISFDLGYRHYDFGSIKPSDTMVETDPLGAVVSERSDVKTRARFSTHMATFGIKFQI
jgi:opacity protein-like surface antigen